MAWAITFTNDTDNPNIGTAVAVWTDDNGVLASVTFQSRVDHSGNPLAMGDGGLTFDDFVAQATAKLKGAIQAQQTVSDAQAKITDALNTAAADPSVTAILTSAAKPGGSLKVGS